MRAITSLDPKTRSKIVHSNETNQNFHHLRVQCRAKDRYGTHDEFSEQLFQRMRAVNTTFDVHRPILGHRALQLSFQGYSGHIGFNDQGERINYTLNVHQVTMNKLPRNVSDRCFDRGMASNFLFVFSSFRGGKFHARSVSNGRSESVRRPTSA